MSLKAFKMSQKTFSDRYPFRWYARRSVSAMALPWHRPKMRHGAPVARSSEYEQRHLSATALPSAVLRYACAMALPWRVHQKYEQRRLSATALPSALAAPR